MAKKTILLTGSNGIIGHAIYQRFSKVMANNSADRFIDHFDIVTLSRQLSHPLHSHCGQHIQQDLNDPLQPLPEVDILLHAAGVTDEEVKMDAEKALYRAWFGTEQLLEKSARRAKKLVYISSAHIYGALQGAINEHHLPNPSNLYANCHYLAEQQFKLFSARHAKPLMIIRPCAVYGLPASLDRFNRWALIPYSFPRDLITDAKIQLKTSGRQIRNFVSSDQIAMIVSRFIEAPAVTETTLLNAVGPDNLTIRQFAQLCIDCYQDQGKQGAILQLFSHVENDMAPSLHYQSLHDQPASNLSLNQFVEQMLVQLTR